MDLNELLARFKEVFTEMIEHLNKEDLAAKFLELYFANLDLKDPETIKYMVGVIEDWENEKRSGQEKGVNPTTTETPKKVLNKDYFDGLIKLRNILNIGKVATFDGLADDLLTVGLACNAHNWLVGRDSDPVSRVTLAGAQHVLNRLKTRLFNEEAPILVPSPSGGIYLMWYVNEEEYFLLYIKDASISALQGGRLFTKGVLATDWEEQVFTKVEEITGRRAILLNTSEKH
jgi:hypothetical protein